MANDWILITNQIHIIGIVVHLFVFLDRYQSSVDGGEALGVVQTVVHPFQLV